MDLRPELQLKSVLKAMADVVLPAVDPSNKLAQEQAQLIMGMLNLLILQLPLSFRFDMDELTRSLELADKLLTFSGTLSSEVLAKLTASVESSRDVHTRAAADPLEVQAANVELREKIGALISALDKETPKATFSEISSLIMGNAQQQLLRDRAWLAMQGWERDPAALPNIETLLADSSSTGVTQ